MQQMTKHDGNDSSSIRNTIQTVSPRRRSAKPSRKPVATPFKTSKQRMVAQWKSLKPPSAIPVPKTFVTCLHQQSSKKLRGGGFRHLCRHEILRIPFCLQKCLNPVFSFFSFTLFGATCTPYYWHFLANWLETPLQKIFYNCTIRNDSHLFGRATAAPHRNLLVPTYISY